MRVTDFAVKNPQFTLIVFMLVAALGVYSFLTIPRAEDPYFPTPIYGIVAIYPGAGPEEVEREVVKELETELHELDDLKHLRTHITDNVAYIVAEFEPGIDTSKKEQEVRRQVGIARASLPAGVKSVDVQHKKTTNVAIVQLALVAPDDGDLTQLGRTADHLVTRLEGVPGVLGVKGWAYPDDEVRIELDLGRARHSITVPQIAAAISSGNTSVPGGEVNLGTRRFDLQTSGAYDSIDDVKHAVVTSRNGDVITVGDVADVLIRPADDTYIGRYDGKRAAFITVKMREGQNIFAVRDGVMDTLAAFQSELPAGMKVEIGFDQATNVKHRLGGLQRDFAIAILLVLVTLIPLGLRASIVVMVSIPTSLSIGIALLYAFGYSLNQLSIVGFVLALGLLVDDSIVVAENIARHLREGKTKSEAALAASKQIGIAVVGCTATLIFAFLPLLFLPGNAGAFIRSMPVAVVATIAASLFVSLTLIPFLASRIMAGGVHAGKPGAAGDHAEHEGNWAYRAMSRAIEAAYRPVLAAAMRRPVVTLVITGAIVTGAGLLIPKVGFSLFPTAGIPQVMVNLEAPDGTSLAGMDAIAKQAETIVRTEPGIKHILTSVGQGNPNIYYNVAPRQRSSTVADLFVQLDEYDAEETPAMLDRLRAKLRAIPGTEAFIKEFANGPPIEAPIEIRIFGDDLAELRRLAKDVTDVVTATPGTRDVRNPLAIGRTDVAVDLDLARAAIVGVSEIDVDRAVRLAVTGLTIGKLRQPDGRELDLVIGFPRPHRPDLDVLERLEVPSQYGGHLPLAQVGELKLRSSPREIQHDGKQRVVSVTAEIVTGANAQRVTADAFDRASQVPLPTGYHMEPGGLIESQKESFSGMGPAVLIALFGVLAILVLEFRSFSATLIVASVIPLGAAGGVFALYLAGETLSFTASVGFVALIGIEVKNSILLVDFTNQLRAEGWPLEDAIRKAGEARFFPILLTSMTAIGGLIPLVVEHSNLYSPLALVLIGGLISSTILSRLVTPVMSKLLLPRQLEHRYSRDTIPQMQQMTRP